MDNEHQPNEGFITSIERQQRQRNRYLIHVENSPAFSVHEDILVRHRLRKGQWVDSEHIRQLLLEEERQAAFHEAIRYIGRSPRSMLEVKRRLSEKEYDPSIIHPVMERLREAGYLNDEMFSKDWTEHRLHFHKKGSRFIRQELKQKGVAPGLIQETIGAIDPEEEYRHALELGKKRWKKVGDSNERRKQAMKVAGFLARRGYPTPIVQRVIRALSAIEGKSPEEELEIWHEE